MSILIIVVIGVIVFAVSTRPDEYVRELRLCRQHLPERYTKLMSMPFLYRYWQTAVLKSDKTIERTNAAPYYVFMAFSYLSIYAALITLAENVNIRVFREDEGSYVFGGIAFYVAGVVWYPVQLFFGAKAGFERNYPEKRHKNAAAFFLILFLACALLFPGLLKFGFAYGTAELLCAAPLVICGIGYLLKQLGARDRND